jgi:hypothetical protein
MFSCQIKSNSNVSLRRFIGAVRKSLYAYTMCIHISFTALPGRVALFHCWSHVMNLRTLTPIVSTVFLGLIVFSSAAHAAVPCEDMLKDMRATKASATLKDADKAKVDDLETKAVERCNADDDARSDTFLAEAMKLMGK